MLKKAVVLMLALALAVSCLGSCKLFGGEADPAELMANAEAKLASEPYTATVTTKMTAKDPALQEKISSMGAADIVVSSDGNGIKARMSATMGDLSVFKSYTAVGGVLYLDYILSRGESNAAVKEKASLGGADFAAVMSELGAGAEIGYEDFDSMTAEKVKKEHIVTCTGLKAESKVGAEAIISARFDDSMTLSITDATYVATFDKDGGLKSTVLTYTFSVTLNGDIYTMSSEITTVYDYTKAVTIAAPEDADMYTETSYENLMR